MKVWLLGDSIRLFYHKEVEKLLGADYEVFAPAENGTHEIRIQKK